MNVGIPVVLKDSKIWKAKDGSGRCEASAFFYGASGLRSSVGLN